MPTGELPKRYVPAEFEPAIRARWEASGAFRADPARVLSGERKPYAILIPPPNVTARLHLGHALNNALQDILTRTHRMKGFETLWMPGTDHAGIATQTVVDKRLQAEGKPALKDYKRQEADRPGSGRDAFIAKVQAWKDEYEDAITEQLRQMGCSCDWSRQRFTMDPICARAVREAFFILFRDGLIYRGKRLVNWDPASQTALADDEVEMVDLDGSFYYLRYWLVHHDSAPSDLRHVTWGELADRHYPGASAHPAGERAWITVATTRPETYLGDTAVAINPSDPRAQALAGLGCALPLVHRVVPIIADDYVVMPDPEGDDPKARYATGFLKVTPAHDPNDWELGQRHMDTITRRCSAGTAIINVMAPDGSISKDHGWPDYTDQHGAGVFLGLPRERARQRVVEEFKALGLLEAVKPYRHAVGHSYRSHVPIEPYLSDQWYCRVTDDRLRGWAQSALPPEQRTTSTFPPSGEGEMRFAPDRYARTYETWHDNLKDWCISRQLWWGHRIPVWSLGTAGPATLDASLRAALDQWQRDGRVHVQVRDARPADASAGSAAAGAVFVCIRSPEDDEVRQRLEAAGFVQDQDVLDTWFSSALWPLSTMGWPDPEQSEDTLGMLAAFNPSSVLMTAREIITLWVSRMVMFNRYFLSPDGKTPGHAPFHDVFIHAMIQDGEGRKMSKSLGNGVDPLDIIESHGTDAMRFTLCQMTTQTQDVRMPVEPDPATGKNTSPKFDLGRNFVTKLWNAARFAMMNLEAGVETSPIDPASLPLVDRWMLSRLSNAIAACDDAIAQYQFSVYAQTLYDLMWRDFCDWYLEAIKPTIRDSAQQRTVLRQTLETILRLLHPICPFVTEAINERLSRTPLGTIIGLKLPHSGASSTDPGLLCVAGWPACDQVLSAPDAEAAFDRMREIVEAVRQARAARQIKDRVVGTLHAPEHVVSALAACGPIASALAGLGEITTHPPADPSTAIRFLLGTDELHLSGVVQAVDPAQERAELFATIDRLDKEISILEKRLANPGYTEKAPPKMVQETRDQLAQKQAERQAAADRLNQLA